MRKIQYDAEEVRSLLKARRPIEALDKARDENTRIERGYRKAQYELAYLAVLCAERLWKDPKKKSTFMKSKGVMKLKRPKPSRLPDFAALAYEYANSGTDTHVKVMQKRLRVIRWSIAKGNDAKAFYEQLKKSGWEKLARSAAAFQPEDPEGDDAASEQPAGDESRRSSGGKGGPKLKALVEAAEQWLVASERDIRKSIKRSPRQQARALIRFRLMNNQLELKIEALQPSPAKAS